ncbi:amino acid adenylation domain-containing protein, partial [Gordonia phosphorivorans]|uniref:amino acid adenylation domain-containing protein n=1 Tax=Gordonia phosphorivorans TaxID=1056982 RepID=UPI0036180455
VGRAPALPPVTSVVPRPERVPLSFAQQRMWFLNQFDPSAATYNIPVVLRLTGVLDIKALRQAVADAVVRHEVLRTTFPAFDGVPYELIAPADRVSQYLDWAVVDSQDQLEAAVTAGFDVRTDQPLRIRLWQAGSGEYVLAVVAHHIASDGESMRPLVTDMVSAYAARSAGDVPDFPPLAVQFADYAIWQHEVLGSPEDATSVVGRQLSYWREQLAGAPDVLDLPTDRVRPAVATHRGARYEFVVPADLGRRVSDLARAAGATPFMVVHGALAVLLGRLAATGDVSIATPIAGRGHAVLDALVGMFVNTLVLRTQIAPADSFTEVINQITDVDLAAFDHADAPFETVVDAVDPVRSEAFGPLAQVVLAVTQGVVEVPAVEVGQLDVAPVAAPEVAARYDLDVNIGMLDGESWPSSIVFATDLFDEVTIGRLVERFLTLLDELTADPSRAVGDVDILDAGERERWAALPAPVHPDSADRTLVELFADSVVQHSRRPAVSALGRTLSYAELDELSSVVAAGLAAQGVNSGDLVGLATARSVDLVVAILGVLKAGAAYLPLDATNPVDRLSHIVADSGVRVVITDRSTTGHPLWSVMPAGVAVIDVADLSAGSGGAAVPAGPVLPASLAYVIYTSGSTGLPKGVEVTHADVAALMSACREDFDFRSDDVWTLFHSYAFDFSVWELWGPLLSGARVAIVDRELARDIDAFTGFLEAEQVTVLSLTPSAFYQLIDARRRCGPELALRYVVFGGEELSFDHVDRWFDENPDDTAQLVNMYGITETTVHVSYRPILRGSVSGADRSFIGRALSSLSIYLLDDRLRPVPEGVAGEMYVGGAQLAQGYLERRELTATRFVANPFADEVTGTRLYRTGDRARWIGDDIEYLGRADGQVQLRGFRIEFGEVEAALLSAPGVIGAAAAIAADPVRGDLLVGYVVGDGESASDVSVIREFTGSKVPRYMVPDVVVAVDRLPLTANGKLDRRALPAPDFGDSAEYVEPVGDDEIAVAQVFVDVLGVERVSVTTSFFDLGGNSLSAMRVAARVGEALGADLSVRDLFDNPTVRELAGMLAGITDTDGARAPMVKVDPRPDRVPLSFAQQRLWLVNRLDPTSTAYNIPTVLRLTGALDLDALHAAVARVVQRHEILRTTFPETGGVAEQKIGRASAVAARLDWDIVDSEDELREAVLTGFDVTKSWPIRVRVWPVSADEHVLAVVVHHIAFDGESRTPMVTDMIAAYLAELADEDPVFGPMDIQFADYAIWQHRVLGTPDDPDSVVGRQLEQWRETLSGLPDLVELPSDRPRPATPSGAGAIVSQQIPADLADRISVFAAEQGATPFMVVHAALAAMIARLTGSDDIAVGTPIAGRGSKVLDPLVGMFVNTLVLRTGVDGNGSFTDLVAGAKHADLTAFANADVPFEAVVDAVDPARSSAFAPFTQVWLSFDQGAAQTQSAELAAADIGGLHVEGVDPGGVPARIDLLVTVVQTPDSDDWHVDFTYAVDLFDESTVATFGDYLIGILHAGTDQPTVAVGDLPLVAQDREPAAGDAGPAPSTIVPEYRVVDPVADAHQAMTVTGDAVEPVLLKDIFARAAELWGPRQAVVDGSGAMLTYAQLDARSNQLARWLIERGAGTETLVALAIGRSVDLLVAIWAVSKTGAGYVPIDPDYPADRVSAMIEDSRASLGLTLEAVGSLPSEDVTWRPLDSAPVVAEIDGMSVAPIATNELRAPVRVHNTAYVIFTSGSTGRPKGVAVTHAGLANFAEEERRRSSADEYARVLGFASPSFDASVLEYLLATASGGVLIYRPAEAVGGTELQDYMMRQAVTHTFLTPTVLSTMESTALPALRVVYAGGEAVPQALKDQWATMRRVQNLYGPTETTIGVTISEPMHIGAPVYLGGPINGVGLLVLDNRLKPVPPGVPGELYIVGHAVSRGYLDDPGLTSVRFVANPYGRPGDRMYRTGDIVRWRKDPAGLPALEYSGRSDDQVKMRGLRIELGEIESALASHEAVDSAVVIGVGGSVATALAAYVVGHGEIDVARVKSHLAERLPSHMVPASITVLDALPLTPVGKLDKRALPEPVIEAGEYIAPATDTERAVAAVFAELLDLDLEAVSATADFFDQGGNSLSATRLAARVSEKLDAAVTVRDIFETSTVRELAAAAEGRAAALAPIVKIEQRPERVPLSYAQQRMWFINQLDPSRSTYNIPAALRLTGTVDIDALRDAFADVVTRHEVLRTVFPVEAGTPRQDVQSVAAAVERLDWAIASGPAEFEADLRRGFDTATELPVRMRLLRDGDDVILAIVVHHIAFDGQSFGPLVTDLLTAYVARAAGGAPEFAPLPVQFADYALWQHGVLGAVDDPESVVGRQIAYWRDQLAGVPDVHELPTDHPRPLVASQRGAQSVVEIPAEVAGRVADLAAEAGVTRFMVFHAALAVLLSRLSGVDDIVVGTPIAGRGQREL